MHLKSLNPRQREMRYVLTTTCNLPLSGNVRQTHARYAACVYLYTASRDEKYVSAAIEQLYCTAKQESYYLL